LRLTLANPRLCGWRRLHGEIVKDDNGQPVIGAWQSIVDVDTWLSINAIVSSRKNRKVYPDGSVGDALAADFAEHRHLLSGIVRCGKPKADGSLCGAPLRARWYGATNVLHYSCQPRRQGGCAGISRRGRECDLYVSELVLAKLEQRELLAPAHSAWDGEADLVQTQAQLDELGREWRAGGISNDFFFRNVRDLEDRLARLRAAQGRHAATLRRRVLDIEDVRRRWYADEADGGLDIMQKRALIREALHAVIVHPAKVGRGRMDPNLLEPVWRED
jgi:hypothetical protein